MTEHTTSEVAAEKAAAADLRRDIDQTRRHMATTVDAIEDRVTPSRIIHRRRNRMRSRLATARDLVMGVPRAVGSDVAAGAQSTRAEMGTLGHGLEVKAENNPFAAGLVAFGAGMLVASLLPTTEPERQAGARARAVGEELREPLSEAAHSVAEAAKAHGGEALNAVKDAGAGATAAVSDTAKEKMAETRQQMGDRGTTPTET